MGRKPGKQDISKEKAKPQVLELLAQGATVTDAMRAVGRNDATFRQWTMQDAEFKAESEKARRIQRPASAHQGRGRIDMERASIGDGTFETLV